MSLVEIVKISVLDQMQDIADRICNDYKSTVTRSLKHPGNSSGEAADSIHVEQISGTKYRIGAENLHLFFFEEGNGTGGIPKRGNPKAPMPMTFGARGTPVAFRQHASNYPGKHCNRTVANKYK